MRPIIYIMISLMALMPHMSEAEELLIEWENPTNNVDGSPINLGDISKATLFINTQGQSESQLQINYPSGAVRTSVTVNLACETTTVFSMTVTNRENLTSGRSNTLTKTTNDCVNVPKVPLPPILVKIDGELQAIYSSENSFGGTDFVVVPQSEVNLSMASGRVDVDFNVSKPTNGKSSVLLTKDMSGFLGGGHFAMYVTPDAKVCARHQNLETANTLCSEAGIGFSQDISMSYIFGPLGAKLLIDDQMVAEDPSWTEGATNDLPLVIGASSWGCGGQLNPEWREGDYSGTECFVNYSTGDIKVTITPGS